MDCPVFLSRDSTGEWWIWFGPEPSRFEHGKWYPTAENMGKGVQLCLDAEDSSYLEGFFPDLKPGTKMALSQVEKIVKGA
jgi:hypothetical protein